MAAVAVLAELRLRDGHREKICVKVENNLSSLITGIHQLNADASRLLSELVERENPRGACAEQGVDERRGSVIGRFAGSAAATEQREADRKYAVADGARVGARAREQEEEELQVWQQEDRCPHPHGKRRQAGAEALGPAGGGGADGPLCTRSKLKLRTSNT
ncbi:hypothetical protein EPR50_G00192530 [Perca flavescens]|uniref:Uncharacterized protein n=1 Tax=Perca flavescens TaxID=8167 RepID=A0A484CA66_PERFV|nr:hypothetical protein EPR50_G00192530 [Perca flavescens]